MHVDVPPAAPHCINRADVPSFELKLIVTEAARGECPEALFVLRSIAVACLVEKQDGTTSQARNRSVESRRGRFCLRRSHLSHMSFLRPGDPCQDVVKKLIGLGSGVGPNPKDILGCLTQGLENNLMLRNHLVGTPHRPTAPKHPHNFYTIRTPGEALTSEMLDKGIEASEMTRKSLCAEEVKVFQASFLI